ncbi:T9SS type A sorting domain-containing protein [Spirosoma fluminis]
MKHLFTFLFLFSASLSLQAQIVFDGSPGGGSPPPTLGGYTMTSVTDSRAADRSEVSFVNSPLRGSIGFSPNFLIVQPLPLNDANWYFYWGNGYTGKVYANYGLTFTLTLPAGTKAFYFYAQPESIGTYKIQATTQNGTSSGEIQATGSSNSDIASAKYFGFYVNQPGVTIETITITTENSNTGIGIGQFGIYQVPCPSFTPTLTASNNGVLTCSRTSVRLTAGGGDAGATYQFNNGPQIGGPTSRTTTASQSGPYSVTVTNPGGCSATATTEVTSQTATPENVTLNNNGPLTCERTSVRLTVPSAGNNATYAFSGPFPVSQPTGTSSRTATVSNPGEYTVLVTNAQGCTATATTEVASNTAPPSNLSLTVSNVLTCAQPTAVLNASANGNAQLVITGPGGQSYSANTATVSQPGEYTLTATRNNGCSATRTVTVEINTTPPQNLSLTNNGPLTCAQTSVQLTASSSTTGVSYGLAGPESFSASGPTASVNRPGTYTVTATGANGCTAVQSTTVESNTITPSVSLTNSGPLSFTNANVTLTATATPGDNVSYSFSSNAAQQGSSNQAQVTTAGVYSVTITRQDNGCSAIASTTVLGGNNPTACRGATAVINVTVEGDPVKYEWYKNSLTTPKIMETPQLFRGTATSSLTLINAQTNTQGNFFLKVTDRSGTVRIYGPYRLTVDASCRAREIASLETPLQVELAPNPIQQDRLRAVVRGAEGRSLQVELIDLSGKPIRQQHWQQAESGQMIDWDMQSQGSGLYLLQVISEAGAGIPAQRQSVKVVKP